MTRQQLTFLDLFAESVFTAKAAAVRTSVSGSWIALVEGR